MGATSRVGSLTKNQRKITKKTLVNKTDSNKASFANKTNSNKVVLKTKQKIYVKPNNDYDETYNDEEVEYFNNKKK